jgi:anti-sigma-K factor RskA
MKHNEILELVPLYALDALEGDEHLAVRNHLATCESCRAELQEYHSIAAGFTEDAEAPAHIWARIEAGLDDDGQAPVVPFETPRSGAPPFMKWILGAAAAIALVFGGIFVGQNLADDNLATDSGVVAAAQSAAEQPGSFISDFLVDDVAVAQVVITAEGLGYVVPTDDLEALPSDRTYQLWVVTPDELVISAGVLGADPAPSTFTWSGDIAGFALTREVAGGVVSSAGDVVSLIET